MTPEELVTKGDLQQYMSFVGSLSWVARVCRADLAYDVSQLQQLKQDADVKNIHIR